MNQLGQRPDVGEFRRAYPWMVLVVVALFLVLVGKLVVLQVIQHADNAAIARDNIVHRVTLATSRGIIRDRNGVVLAGSRESWNVYVLPARLDVDKTWPILAETLGLGPVERASIEQRVRAARDADLSALRLNPKHHLHEVLVREDVGRDVVGALETQRDQLSAVSWLSAPMRYYPLKDLTFHLLGYVNEASREDLASPDALPGLQAGDRIGRMGIEKAWESALHGSRGWRKVILDARGNRRNAKEDLALIDEPRESPPIPGKSIRLTIDSDLQATARRAFAGQLAGGVVVVEVKTGRVLVDYSKPGVDGNDFVEGLSHKEADAILDNPLRPLIDKTMYEAYFPGSTVKPFMALAALRTHSMASNDKELCEHIHHEGKTRFKCEGYHGEIDMRDAIVRSCNIFFYKLGKKTGLDNMAAMLDEFGMGQRTGVGLNNEVPGLIPTKAWYSQHYGGQFRTGFTLNAAIGQGNTKVTVLQMAMAYAALADGGRLYVPKLVRSIETPIGPGDDGAPTSRIEQEFAPELRRTVNVPAADLRFVLDAMKGVVNDDGGTAYSERTTKVMVAGKTGTAQVSKIGLNGGVDPHLLWYFNRDHAWFGGFAPFDDPEIAIVVLVEHGGGGGHNAAPIAMRLFDDYFERKKGVPSGGAPQQGATAKTQPHVETPRPTGE